MRASIRIRCGARRRAPRKGLAEIAPVSAQTATTETGPPSAAHGQYATAPAGQGRPRPGSAPHQGKGGGMAGPLRNSHATRYMASDRS